MDDFDLLGGNLTFHSNKQETIKTKFGGFISAVTIIFLGLLIAGFGQDFFKRTNPILVQSTLSNKQYPEYIINNKNFSFAFRLEDDDGVAINRPELFYTKVSYINTEKDDKGTYVTLNRIVLETHKCTEEMFYEGSGFVSENNNVLCPQFKNISVGGYWDASFVNRFQIEIYQCIEGNFTPDNMPCGSNKDREKVLANKLYFSVFYQVVVVNPNNYKNGLQRYIKNNYYTLDTRIQKNPYYFYEETIMRTDYGWLLKDITEENIIGFKSNYMDFISLDSLNSGNFAGSLTRAVFYFEKDKKEFHREYQKAQDLAAQVGGILKLFLTIGTFIIHKYNIYSLKLELGSLMINGSNIYSQDTEKLNNNKLNFSQVKEDLVSQQRSNLNSHFKVDFSPSKFKVDSMNESNLNMSINRISKFNKNKVNNSSNIDMSSQVLRNKVMEEIDGKKELSKQIENSTCANKRISNKMLELSKYNQNKNFDNKTNDELNKFTASFVNSIMYFAYFSLKYLCGCLFSNKKGRFMKLLTLSLKRE